MKKKKSKLEEMNFKKVIEVPDVYIEWENELDKIRVSYVYSNDTLYARFIDLPAPAAMKIEELNAFIEEIDKNKGGIKA